MKEQYISPELEIYIYNNEDIISTSIVIEDDGGKWSEWYD